MKELKIGFAKLLAFLVGGIGMNFIREEVVAYGLLLFLAIVVLGVITRKRLTGRWKRVLPLLPGGGSLQRGHELPRGQEAPEELLLGQHR